MAALTNKVWSCSSDCVMVQHAWSLYFFRLAVFSLADSGVSNLPTRFSMVAPRKTAPDDLHSSALTTSSRDARKWANSRSWMSSYITAESCLGNNGRSIVTATIGRNDLAAAALSVRVHVSLSSSRLYSRYFSTSCAIVLRMRYS
jgi:hypothetical protein